MRFDFYLKIEGKNEYKEFKRTRRACEVQKDSLLDSPLYLYLLIAFSLSLPLYLSISLSLSLSLYLLYSSIYLSLSLSLSVSISLFPFLRRRMFSSSLSLCLSLPLFLSLSHTLTITFSYCLITIYRSLNLGIWFRQYSHHLGNPRIQEFKTEECLSTTSRENEMIANTFRLDDSAG